MTIRQLAAFTVWAVIVAASGCQSTPPYVAPTPPPQDIESGPEATLARAGQATGAQAAQLYLAAALQFLESGEPARANEALSNVAVNVLPEPQHASFWLTRAQLSLQAGDQDAAQASLQQALLAPGPDHFAIANLATRLCLLRESVDLRRYACAVQQLADVVPPQEQLQETNDRIWDLLSRSPAMLVEAQVAGSTGNAHGWWQLKAAMLAGFSVAQQRQLLKQWRQQWPEHPASRRLPAALQALRDDRGRPRHVALVLPLSGPLARAGRAVRDGFISAYLHSAGGPAGAQAQPESRSQLPQPGPADSPQTPARFTISVYDSAAEPLPRLLEQALLQGADLIVGPLAKQRVEQINALNPAIPVVTLNYLDTHSVASSSLLQLGLAIEDEADNMVSRLLLDNVERVLVFHSYQDWSRRAAQRVRDNWPFPLAEQSFTDIRTITESVGQAMDVQASVARRDELAQALGTELEFLPRARQDVEAIVALVDTLEAQALAPALRFHFAQGVPVYATSQTLRGARPEDLRDLQGFRISELPWFLESDDFYARMNDAFGITGNPFSALYALGVDAFRVSDRLSLLQRGSPHQLIGSTGILSLEQSGRIRRQLPWGVVRGTTLTPVSAAR